MRCYRFIIAVRAPCEWPMCATGTACCPLRHCVSSSARCYRCSWTSRQLAHEKNFTRSNCLYGLHGLHLALLLRACMPVPVVYSSATWRQGKTGSNGYEQFQSARASNAPMRIRKLYTCRGQCQSSESPERCSEHSRRYNSATTLHIFVIMKLTDQHPTATNMSSPLMILQGPHCQLHPIMMHCILAFFHWSPSQEKCAMHSSGSPSAPCRIHIARVLRIA